MKKYTQEYWINLKCGGEIGGVIDDYTARLLIKALKWRLPITFTDGYGTRRIRGGGIIAVTLKPFKQSRQIGI